MGRRRSAAGPVDVLVAMIRQMSFGERACLRPESNQESCSTSRSAATRAAAEASPPKARSFALIPARGSDKQSLRSGPVLARHGVLHPSSVSSLPSCSTEQAVGTLESGRTTASPLNALRRLWDFFYVPCRNDGNQNELAGGVGARVSAIVRSIIRAACHVDKPARAERSIAARHSSSSPPYNRRSRRIAGRLPGSFEWVTVDRFQGQEAPVVIYSMTTSSPRAPHTA